MIFNAHVLKDASILPPILKLHFKHLCSWISSWIWSNGNCVKNIKCGFFNEYVNVYHFSSKPILGNNNRKRTRKSTHFQSIVFEKYFHTPDFRINIEICTLLFSHLKYFLFQYFYIQINIYKIFVIYWMVCHSIYIR